MIDDAGEHKMQLFIDALTDLYPEKAAHIYDTAHEQGGPTLAELAIYGERIDTGSRVAGNPIWRFVRNDVHVCEVEPGGHELFRWAEFDPEPTL